MDTNSENNSIPICVKIIAILMSLFHLYTGYFQFTAMSQRVPHVVFALVLIFLYYDWRRNKKTRFTITGAIGAVLSIGIGVYVLYNWMEKAGQAGLQPPIYEIALGLIFILLCLEASRRTLGIVFPILTLFTVLYARFGELVPGVFAHPNYSLIRIVDKMFVSTEGVFGMLTGISATYIFLFILFGAMLRAAGGGDFFINFAYSILGNVRGGPSKIAVATSALLSMITGSGPANVAGTGQITIPLMKKYGYKPHFAGAVEATASAGGLMTPPIMGSAAFVIMQVLGVSYLVIMKSAILIAILYFLTLFFMLDLEDQKLNIAPLPKESLPDFKKTLKEGWFYFLPIILLVYLLIGPRLSITLSVFWSTLSIPLVTVLGGKKGIIRPNQIILGLQNGALTALPVVAILAVAGIVMGMFNITGVSVMLSSMLVKVAGGNVFILLVLTMVAAIILGMGMPPVASYIILAILMVPALTKLGIEPLAAHLFVFYFAILAEITPPMAPDAFVASSIAEAPVMRIAFTSCRLAIVAFVIPYMFVYNNALLLIGSFQQVALVCITAPVGVYAIACAVQNYLYGGLNFLIRLVLFLAGFCLLYPGWQTDIVGLVVVFAVFTFRRIRFLKTKPSETSFT
ncbi:MAG: TRAP transporter permease [Bacteroidales bacterium]